MNQLQKQCLNSYFETVSKALHKINLEELITLVDLMKICQEKNGIIFTCGNGGSAATASHFTGDILKGLSFPGKKRFKSICLSDNQAGMMAIANDISYEYIFVEPLKNLLGSNDMLLTFSGSGNSKNILKAIEYGNKRGVPTVSICGFDGGEAKKIARCALHVSVDDMEASEDIHMIMMHAVKKIWMSSL